MLGFQNPLIEQSLIDRVLADRPTRGEGIHGLSHWLRVERNGLYLAKRERADSAIISLFALFHDSRRINDATDPEHGARGARLAEELFAEGLLPLDTAQLEILLFACENHTDILHTGDTTVACCWDADRLDLPRVGVSPDSRFLNTSTAKQIANTGNLGVLV